MSAPVGVAPRRAALSALDRVLNRGEPLDGALERSSRGLAGPDRGLAHALAAETLRRLPDLDALIDSATRQPLPSDAKARAVLRLALTQALALGTPPHAAIATALPLVTGGPKRLVHGVFGTLMRGQARLPDPPTLPAEVAERWERQWGAETVAAAAHAIARPPPLDLTLKPGAEPPPGALRLAEWSVRLEAGTEVTAVDGFGAGDWWVQDLAASLPARLLGEGEGRAALDLCAAPGGKTMQLAAAGWAVTAVDRSRERLGRLADNLARTGLVAELVAGDVLELPSPLGRGRDPLGAAEWEGEGDQAAEQSPSPSRRFAAPSLSQGERDQFSAVLLDAPCTATGTFRRHPEVLHRVTPRAVATLAEAQAAMIDRAVTLTAPGGRLVYATCSLERAEGEEQAIAALARHERLRIEPVRADELPPGIAPAPEGWVRTLPTMLGDEGRLDGFFIVRFAVA